MKRSNKIFKIECLVIRLHSNICSKDYNHSLALVYRGKVFDYKMMTNGEHVYPVLSKELTCFKANNKKYLKYFDDVLFS